MNAPANIDTTRAIPSPDHTAIRSHIEMQHALAKNAGVEGVLTLTRIDGKDKIFTERFAIGDVDSHANAVIGWSSNTGVNLYSPWAIFRNDLPRGSKGAEEHVVAALAFVGDLDADNGKAGTGLVGLPLASPYIMETSEGNFQPVFPLARALSRAEAKPIAVALSDAIGADPRTKDTSGLFRIAGTLNWPSAKKLERGRSAVPQLVKVKLAWTGELVEPATIQAAVKDAKPSAKLTIVPKTTTVDWTKVADDEGWLKSVNDLPKDFSSRGRIIVGHTGNIKDLNFDMEEAGLVVTKPYQSWSEVSIALAAIFKNHGGYTTEKIAAALICDLECNQHVTKLPTDAHKRRAVERSIARSYTPSDEQKVQRIEGDPDWRERRINGKPVPSMHNARLAITALGIDCSRDTFHNKTLFGYREETFKHELQSILGEVSDDGIVALRQMMSERFGFDMEDKATRDAVKSLALENCFNPVCDLIDRAEADWDGVERLDSMAVDFLNCEGTEINSAFMRKTMIALVKRAREPGCKFDTITVLESPEGFNKSTAWRVLAGDENYSDERILGLSAREAQEQLSEVWIHENADLAGLKKTDVESVKAYASRAVDIARAAFGHFVQKKPRHSIETGTTNSSEYLQSQTGNRRFWPMTVLQSIDIAKLAEYRLQLIGEAAKYQSAGESVVLDEALWGDAGIEQEQRRTKDPWEGMLEHLPVWWDEVKGYDPDGKPIKGTVLVRHISGGQELVSAATLLKHVLDIPISHQTTVTAMRLSTVMKQLGWQRHKNGYVSIPDHDRVKGYFRALSEDDLYARRALELQQPGQRFHQPPQP
jgi:predicted P-loop ATPase